MSVGHSCEQFRMPSSNKQSMSHLQASQLSVTAAVCSVAHRACMYALSCMTICLRYSFASVFSRAVLPCSGQNPFGAPPSSGPAPASNPFAAPGGYQGAAGQGGYSQQQGTQGGYTQQGYGGAQVVPIRFRLKSYCSPHDKQLLAASQCLNARCSDQKLF